MIWLLGITLALVMGVYLAAPFLAPPRPSKDTAALNSAEIDAYRIELRALEKSDDANPAKKAVLQAQLLKAAKAQTPNMGARSWGLAGGICVGLVGASVGLYSVLGTPNFTPEVRQAPPAKAAAAGTDFTALLPRFEARLAESPEDAVGWALYGRTLMLAGDAQAGLRAYEKALELTDTPDIRKEYEAAQKFAKQIKSGPDAETIANLQNLSEADQKAAIENMVEGLRDRLEAEPNNPEGWIRLLKSRKVLDQETAAKADMEILRQALPNQAEAIIAQSGWRN